MSHSLDLPPELDDAPAAPDAARPRATLQLAALRQRLDAIDDAVHDLLMRRAAIVQQVGASKPQAGVQLRPGREAAMLRRLMARHHGALPRTAILRIWRELLAGSVAMQGAFSIAVADRGLLPAARAHFGTLVPLADPAGTMHALAAVRTGRASVAVLPLPRAGGRAPWWPALLHQPDQSRLHVIARLPFWTTSMSNAADQALVVGPLPPDPSGDDVSLLGVEPAAARSQDRLARQVSEAGFRCEQLLRHSARNGVPPALAWVSGAVQDDDPRLARLPGVTRVTVLGCYARPLPETAA